MDSVIRSECGRPVLMVEYDGEKMDWDEAIRAAYAVHGLRPGQIMVIAKAKQHGAVHKRTRN